MIIFSALAPARPNWKSSVDFFLKNLDLIEEQNKEKDFSVEVSFISNSLEEETIKLLEKRNIKVFEIEIPTNLYRYKNHPSVQHAIQLNEFINRHKFSSQGKDLLIIDPDFYVFGEEWISYITKFAQKRNLDLFGAPYHQGFGFGPCFPTVFLMLIRNLSNKHHYFDFLPDLNLLDNLIDDFGNIVPDSNISKKLIIKCNVKLYQIYNFSNERTKVFNVWPKLKNFLTSSHVLIIFFIDFFLNNKNFRTRKKLKSRDTGYKIRRKIHSLKLKSQTFPEITFRKSIVDGVDISWYLKNNPDILKNGINPANHFWKYGILENRKARKFYMFWRYHLGCWIHKISENVLKTDEVKITKQKAKLKLDIDPILYYPTAIYSHENAIKSIHIGSLKQTLFSKNLNELDRIRDIITSASII